MRIAATTDAVYAGLLCLVFVGGAVVGHQGLFNAFYTYWPDIRYLSMQHLQLTAMSGGLAVLAAIPLGIWLSRPRLRRYSQTAMQLLNIGATLPTLAVLALSVGLLGIGTLPAAFALFVATLLPITRNTHTGLLDVPQHLLEAASGMGLSPFQSLLKVELPNALPTMFAGIRTALAINVGTVPLAFLIGGGGLGELIFTGIDLNEPVMMLAGAIPTAMLAIAVDAIVAALATLAISRGVNSHRAVAAQLKPTR
ncbi:ABC transporter permease [Pseudomonas antarctica]|jgi:osmoprotectant transport system permease protein|uniref:ABC transporter permease n=1 Tax=Pseudomonas antarctica TaxID=219572 RepID=A0A172Z526_9PSED|nr:MULTISPECIES: ABC transporter permease [Pseudomonas]ANF87099.1 ABC transporter permease [Pseudomonas antarctica]MBX7277446.1 ABC transporter permease [Pseudomonas sp. ERGC3:01]QZC97021.1 ABC transporter permease [Pseudomonas sp. ERGC3:05]UXV17861.1 ABC transporter permease [Pseudomonas fluorescens]